jgi:hypothetical protein
MWPRAVKRVMARCVDVCVCPSTLIVCLVYVNERFARLCVCDLGPLDERLFECGGCEWIRPVTSGAPDRWAYGLEKRACARKRVRPARAEEQGRVPCDACREDVAPRCE